MCALCLRDRYSISFLLLAEGHLRVRRNLERHHAVPRRLERNGLSASPPRISRDRVRAPVALAGRERVEASGEGVVLAMRTKEAKSIVGRTLCTHTSTQCVSLEGASFGVEGF